MTATTSITLTELRRNMSATDAETIIDTPPNDPYRFSSALKSPSEIQLLSVPKNSRSTASSSDTENTSGTARLRRPFASRKASWGKKSNGKALQTFYESQNAKISRMLKSVDDHQQEARDEQGDTALKYKIAVRGSLGANIVLAGLQLYAAISSGSLSLFATMVDSIFDPLSNLLLLLSHRAVHRVDPSRFPSGKSRLSTAGNLFFAFLMIAVSLLLLVLSIQSIARHDGESETTDFHLPSIIAVSIALATKTALYLYCRQIGGVYSQVAILAQDHRNDIPVNAFGLMTSIAGSHLAWYIDPIGAIIIALVIAGIWARTAQNETLLLVGIAAPAELRGLITYLAVTHDERITAIDTVRAYHAGERVVVEVDIVLPEEMPLRETHDIAESLQVKLERLPEVERAYVHVDWESEHKPEHFWKKEM